MIALRLRIVFSALLLPLVSGASSAANATLRFRTRVGCQHWGRECPVPGFVGTDSSPAVGPDGQVVIGSYDGNLYSVDPADGSIIWKAAGAGGEGSPSITTDNKILVWGGITGKTLECLNGTTGATIWAWRCECMRGVAQQVARLSPFRGRAVGWSSLSRSPLQS